MDAAFELVKRNNVLNVNPRVAEIDITTHASDFLWAWFCVLSLSAIGILAWGHMSRPIGERAFHELAAALCFTASIAYFAMASDLGATAVPVEFIRGGSLGENWVKLGVNDPTRSIWYARYIDWTITTPMLLLELALCTGLPLSQIFGLIFFDLVMIETGLVGALVPSRYKWGFYAFGCAALFYIWWILLVPGRKSAMNLGSDFHKSYITSTAVLSVLWLVYPIIWGLAEGGNLITPTSEMIAYGVLDLLAKPVFSIVHLMGLSKLDYARLGMSSSKVSDGAHQTLLNEKMGPNSAGATPRPSTTVGSPTATTHGDGAGFHQHNAAAAV
ncbi:Protein MRH1 [Rhodotorula toruloides]|nr:Protein MRH1 [Rhodotorula toruloides]PRQ74815.1 hypothetical protein AAT19DRAFT_13837 [Rhodotorula toruloides]